ncbi:MAG: hypothetical protein IH571_06360 [Acholeplasmataceae bacterium]|nr:hypothetical protein [Acholeplasmataceae bacterium]
MFKKIRKWVSIKKDQNARGLLLIGIVGFNVCLWFFSSILAFILAPGTYESVARALWESGITWMLEPGFYDPSVAYSIRIISIVVILTSMITFSGGIIGYVASLFSSIIETARQGKGKMYIYDHILILNWNNKALELIADYRYDEQTTNIVVLSGDDKEEIDKAIKRKLYDTGKHQAKMKLNVIVRQGEVFSKSDLMDVCIEDAKTIIILSDEDLGAIDAEKHSDILAMKTLMLVSNLNIKPEQTIIVEVKQQQTINLIKDKIGVNKELKDQIIPILPDELMGRLIAQTILMPDLNWVYQELFSFEGAEFYTVDGIEAEDYITQYPYAIPIYTHDNRLYVLSENEKQMMLKRDKPLSSYQKLEINNKTRYQDKTLLIFGKNNKLEYILDSIRLYERENKTKINVSFIESNEASDIELHTKDLEKIDTILILSNDYLEPKHYDSDVLVTLLMTQEIAKKHHAEIVIELLDPRHFDIAQSYNIKNTIISNEYISRLITQLSKNRHLYFLYEDLLTYDPEDSLEETYEVYAYKAKDIFQNPLPMSFSSKAEFIYSCYMSGNKNYMMIGWIQNGVIEIFKGNLDQKKDMVIHPDDTIITICK